MTTDRQTDGFAITISRFVCIECWLAICTKVREANYTGYATAYCDRLSLLRAVAFFDVYQTDAWMHRLIANTAPLFARLRAPTATHHEPPSPLSTKSIKIGKRENIRRWWRASTRLSYGLRVACRDAGVHVDTCSALLTPACLTCCRHVASKSVAAERQCCILRTYLLNYTSIHPFVRTSVSLSLSLSVSLWLQPYWYIVQQA